jgi:hypothetical protein
MTNETYNDLVVGYALVRLKSIKRQLKEQRDIEALEMAMEALDKSTDERYNLAEASRIVLNQLLECNMFKGSYDARNGKPEFIYGIQTVIENIAYNIDEETGDKISDMITRNIVESMNKAENEKKGV